jgi:hypothetical protein
MLPVSGFMAFCGATIWRDKYDLPIMGGHNDSYDDGHYAQDLATGAWETRLPPSTTGAAGVNVDAYGEWLPNRPASQHSYFHNITVEDDIIQGYGYAIGWSGSASSRQAHRWNGSLGAWERYGTLSGTPHSVPDFVAYDPVRKRIVRIPLVGNNNIVEWIPSNDPTASWSAVSLTNQVIADIYASIGYHAALDAYVLVSPHDYTPTNRVFVMDAGNLSAGWTEVTATGVALPYPMVSGGLEYIPPMKALVSADQEDGSTLYFLTPTGARTDPWAWTKKAFTGSTTPAAWDQVGVQGRVKWSSYLQGLVMIKTASALTEVFTP